jgi:hypothetical protein
MNIYEMYMNRWEGKIFGEQGQEEREAKQKKTSKMARIKKVKSERMNELVKKSL